jgi:hypothetical protein
LCPGSDVMVVETPLLENKSSRLINVEPVEVCSCGSGLPVRVPTIFNLGGQARGASPADVQTMKPLSRRCGRVSDAVYKALWWRFRLVLILELKTLVARISYSRV